MIGKISLVNFRGHTRELSFFPGINILRGPNECGKSTIKEAIAFAWFGTDAVGTKNPDHLITEGAEEMEVAIATPKSTIMRKKRRGATSALKLARQNLPPVPMSQTDLQNLLKSSLEAFMSCWNVGYFMELKTEKKLAVMAELAQLDRRALLMGQLPQGFQVPAKVKLTNPRIDADAIAGDRRQAQNKMASNEGALKVVVTQLQQLAGAAVADVESFQARLNEVNAALEEHTTYDKILAKYNGDLARWESQEARLAEYRKERQKLKILPTDEVDKLETHTQTIDTEIADLNKTIAALEQKFRTPPNAPKKPTGASLQEGAECDKCGQKIDGSHLNRIMEAYERMLTEYNKEASAVEKHNRSLNENILAQKEAISKLEESHRKAVARINEIERENERTYKLMDEFDEKLKAMNPSKPQAPSKPTTDRSELQKEQLELSTDINAVKRHETQLEHLKAQEALLTKSNLELKHYVDSCAQLENALRKLPEIETKTLLETLQVPGVVVEFQDGELTVKSSGILYPSLSSGRRMKVDLAFCQSLRKASKQPPSWMFFDNADLVDKYVDLLPKDVQIFVAKVDSSLSELVINSI